MGNCVLGVSDRDLFVSTLTTTGPYLGAASHIATYCLSSTGQRAGVGERPMVHWERPAAGVSTGHRLSSVVCSGWFWPSDLIDQFGVCRRVPAFWVGIFWCFLIG